MKGVLQYCNSYLELGNEVAAIVTDEFTLISNTLNENFSYYAFNLSDLIRLAQPRPARAALILSVKPDQTLKAVIGVCV